MVHAKWSSKFNFSLNPPKTTAHPFFLPMVISSVCEIIFCNEDCQDYTFQEKDSSKNQDTKPLRIAFLLTYAIEHD